MQESYEVRLGLVNILNTVLVFVKLKASSISSLFIVKVIVYVSSDLEPLPSCRFQGLLSSLFSFSFLSVTLSSFFYIIIFMPFLIPLLSISCQTLSVALIWLSWQYSFKHFEILKVGLAKKDKEKSTVMSMTRRRIIILKAKEGILLRMNRQILNPDCYIFIQICLQIPNISIKQLRLLFLFESKKMLTKNSNEFVAYHNDQKTERMLIQKNLRTSFETSKKHSNYAIERVIKIRQEYQLQELYQSFQFLKFLSENETSLNNSQSWTHEDSIHELCQQIIEQISFFKKSTKEGNCCENIVSRDKQIKIDCIADNAKIHQLVQQILYLRKKISQLQTSFSHLDSLRSSPSNENYNPNLPYSSDFKNEEIQSNKKMSLEKYTQNQLHFSSSSIPRDWTSHRKNNEEVILGEKQNYLEELEMYESRLEETRQIIFILFGLILEALSFADLSYQEYSKYIFVMRSLYQRQMQSNLDVSADYRQFIENSLNRIHLMLETIQEAVETIKQKDKKQK